MRLVVAVACFGWAFRMFIHMAVSDPAKDRVLVPVMSLVGGPLEPGNAAPRTGGISAVESNFTPRDR